jgi:hypothetical protein
LICQVSTFVSDLPHLTTHAISGLIVAVRDDGDEANIEKVQNLVLDVIRKPSCLILLVVSGESGSVYLLFGLYLTCTPQPTSKIKPVGD